MLTEPILKDRQTNSQKVLLPKENKQDEGSQYFDDLITYFIKINLGITRNYLKNFSGYHHDVRDIVGTYSDFVTRLVSSPAEIIKIINFNLDFVKARQDIWRNTLAYSNDEIAPVIDPQKGDKRFLDEEWHKSPYFNFIQQNYLLMDRLVQQIIDEIEIDDKTRRKLDFYAEQYLSALSPSNFLFTNPEVLKLAVETNGKSLWDGLNNLVEDLEKGKISQTDESAYVVGKNLATTRGTVIYENELIQLIQYIPVTKKVFERPILMIPPWINKYYILDLQPTSSLVKFLLEQGISVFMISWRNPKPGMGYLKLDDYVKDGVLKAIDVVKNVSASRKINALGYCLGGTLLSIASSILSSNQKENPIHSATFLAAMVDFSDIGPMGDVVDKALISKLERGELLDDGILKGADMETGFNLIQSKNLIWNYVINNYLKGIKPPAIDVMYWTNDNTNLPAAMYLYYMKYIVFENKLSKKNELTICDVKVDIGKIDLPVIVIALKEDIISPAKTVFLTTDLVKGPVEFILGESGHVMGVVNPPSKKKYGHYIHGALGRGFEEWKKTAEFVVESWWLTWVEKLKKLSGKEIASTLKTGSEEYKAIEPAPGKFVKEKES